MSSGSVVSGQVQFNPWAPRDNVLDYLDQFLTVTWKGREHFGKLHNLSTTNFRVKETEWVRDLNDPNPLSIDIANQAHFFQTCCPVPSLLVS